MGRAFAALLGREAKLAWRRRGQQLQPLLFYVLVMMLFPLGMGPEPEQLAQLAPSLLWVAALLAALLVPGALFAADFEDGSIELWMTCGVPLAWLMLAKLLIYAAIVTLPLLLLSPLLGAWFGLQDEALWMLPLTLALGLPVLCWVGALGAALTLGLPRGGMLIALIVLPFYIPVLLFGSSAVHAAAEGRPTEGAVALLAGLGLIAGSLSPVAVAAALRAAQE